MTDYHTIKLEADETYLSTITEMLEPRFRVTPDGPLGSGDLCIIEQRLVSNRQNDLEAVVKDERPAFYPIVMVRQRTPSDAVDLPHPTGPALIDDVVTLPIDTTVLHRRLDTLLTRRRYSISLARYYEKRHERFDGLFDAIAEPALVLDEDGVVVQGNDRLIDLLGANRSEVVGSPLAAALGTDLKEVLRLEEPGVSGNRQTRTISFTDGNDSKRYTKLSIRAVSLMGEEYAVVILTDVTAIHDRLEHLEQRLKNESTVSTE